MKTVKMLATAGVTGTVAALTLVSPAFAWHPKGVIVKSVSNVTTNSAMSNANDESTAVSAKPGDILLYTIVVSNNGAPANNGDDDMAHTVMTDTLPAGVELVSNPSQRTITVDLGTIKPGKSVTKSFQVKVTSNTDGDLITNKACFTGNSLVNDNPQSGCDTAVVKVNVPATPTPTPTPQPTKPATPKPKQPAALPNTGTSASLLLIAGAVAGVSYVANLLHLKRKSALQQ